MAVIAIESQQRCKLCKHAERTAIDALLERRSKLESDGDGKRINLEYVLARFAEWGVENPTGENVKNHWKKHCEVVSEEEAEARVDAAADAIQQILADPDAPIDVEGSLRRIIALGMAELEQRVKSGLRTGVTIDHIMKASDALARRGQNEAQAELLKAIGGGVADVFAKALNPTPPVAVIEAHTTAIEDAEVEA